jgi:putative flippase GtrA
MSGRTSPSGNDTLGALFRYGVVGIGQNLVAYAATLGLMAAGLAAWQATAVVYPLATLMSFVANKLWSFQKRPKSTGQFIRFVTAYILVYPIATGITWGLVAAGVDPRLATLASIGGSAVILFIVLTLWVFPKERQQR